MKQDVAFAEPPRSFGLREKMVSVIVPVWNGQDTIGRCLESLSRQTFPRERTQLIVVDNGSTDGTVDIVRSFENVLLLTEQAASSYRARNLGLLHATGDYVAFTDADCEAAPQWIEAGISTLHLHSDVAIAAGRVQLVPTREAAYSRAAHVYEELFAFRQDESARMGRSVTANWMSPRWVFQKIGNFDPELKSGGDLDLSGKVSDAGYDVRYASEMVVFHPTRSSRAELFAKRRRVSGGMWVRGGGRRALPRLMIFTAGEALKRSIKALLASDYSLLDRLRVAGLLMALGAVGNAELVRLALGGQPRRA